MNTYNVNFKGYDNVFSAFGVPVKDGKRVTVLSMRLNDNDGYNDLEVLKKIKQMQSLPLGNENDDILVLSYIDDTKNKKESLYFNNKPMYWGDELRQIEEKFIPRLMTKEQYQLEKDIHMKQYTLLASLTSRLMYAEFDGEDQAKSRVISKMHDTLGVILKDSVQAFNVTLMACLKKFKFQDISMAFNHGITKTMKHFFKIR